MNVFEILHAIQDARAQLTVWGLSTDTLVLIAAAALVVFLFSLRELLSWYLRLGQIRRDLTEIKSRLDELKGPTIAPPAPPLESAVPLNLEGPERL